MRPVCFQMQMPECPLPSCAGQQSGAHLGGTMLLGMSFLGRYRLTIDDADNRITLSRSR